MYIKDLIGEHLTVSEFINSELFPWDKFDTQYSQAVSIQKKVCDCLGCTPDFCFIVTSDNTSNLLEFNRVFDEACQELVKSKVGQYNIINYGDTVIATAYEEGGLAVMYIPCHK